MKKRYIKTYAAKGLLECKMSLRIGKATVTIPFSGGSMGSNGVISAKYVTANPAIQALIEGSRQFISERVYLYKKVEVAAPLREAADKQSITPTENSGYESEGRGAGKESGDTLRGDTSLYV